MRVYIIGQQGDGKHVWHFQGVVFSQKKAIQACVTPKFFYFRAKIGQLFATAPTKAKDAGIAPIFPLKDLDLSKLSTDAGLAMANVAKQIANALPTAKQAAKRLHKALTKR